MHQPSGLEADTCTDGRKPYGLYLVHMPLAMRPGRLFELDQMLCNVNSTGGKQIWVPKQQAPDGKADMDIGDHSTAVSACLESTQQPARY